MVWVISPLGGEDVALIWKGPSGVKTAVLEDDGGVAEDEVDGAVDVALGVELSEGMDVESVLVGHEVAAVKS